MDGDFALWNDACPSTQVSGLAADCFDLLLKTP